MVTPEDVKWRDVSKPPEHNKWVLLTTGRRDVLVGYYSDGKWFMGDGLRLDGVISWQPWPGGERKESQCPGITE